MLKSFHEEVLNGYEARILTPELDLYGQIYLPAQKVGLNAQSTADWLNHNPSPLVPMAGVRMYRSAKHQSPALEDMLAVLTATTVRKQDILFVSGGRPQGQPNGSFRRRRAALLYPGLVLAGWLLGPQGLSFGEYMAQSKPFQTLFEAELYRIEAGKPLSQTECSERYEFVSVNLHQVRSFFSPPERAGSTELTLL